MTAFPPFSVTETDDPRATPLEGRLLSEACNFYGVDESLINSKKRGYYSKVRRALAVVLVDQVGWSERRVAKTLNIHHSAIQESLVEAKILLRDDPLFFEIVERLRQIVSST